MHHLLTVGLAPVVVPGAAGVLPGLAPGGNAPPGSGAVPTPPIAVATDGNRGVKASRNSSLSAFLADDHSGRKRRVAGHFRLLTAHRRHATFFLGAIQSSS